MDITGDIRLPGSREAVWRAINDPAVLCACISGCQSLERVSEHELRATIGAKLGLLKVKFNGVLRLENVRPPEGCRLIGEGSGGIAGFAKGYADIRLVEDGPETVLSYTADAEIGGRIAKLGGKLIDAATSRLAARFFGNLSAHLTGAAIAAEAAEAE